MSGPKSAVRLRRGERAYLVIIEDEHCAEILVGGDTLEELRDGLEWWGYTGLPIRVMDDEHRVVGWVSAIVCSQGPTRP